jgi:hypothetical protein
MEDTYYVSNADLTSGALNDIVIDEFGNSIEITFNGFTDLTYEIPFYIVDNDKYFRIYRQDGITSATSRVALVEDTDYKIDYNNGKIKLYNTLNWDADTEIWIENYVYDKVYYKYLSSARFETGDIDSNNFQFTHSQLRKMFHKALQKILFWIPLTYDYDNGYISPRLDERLIDFVAEMTKLIAMQSVMTNKIGNAISVTDGDTKLDLSAGNSAGLKMHEINIKEAMGRLRAAIDDYCLEQNYMMGNVESTQYTTGSLF